ncbi:MAG: hypothetical protein ACLQIB_21605, partial [Isosphaeraceae bacterium]
MNLKEKSSEPERELQMIAKRTGWFRTAILGGALALGFSTLATLGAVSTPASAASVTENFAGY